MHVDLALFEGDELLGRNQIRVGGVEAASDLGLFHANHQLGPNAARIVLSNFAPDIDLKTITLDTPIHESVDWESIELGRYTLALWCRLDA